MASHATHIRRIYSRPWRNGSLANPGKIPTGIQVSVRPETTGTLETMLEPCTQLPAGRTGLAGVGRIDVHDGDPNGTGLVLDEALQLPERPAVEPCAHAPAGPKAIADVRKVLHYDRGGPNASGFLENRLARFVIDVFDTPPLLAGDLPESLSRTLAVVGLEATTQGQMLITPMAQCLSAPDPARAGGGESIFPNIHTHHGAGCHPLAVGRLDGEIEKPFASTKYQFRLLRQAARQDLALVIPEDHRHPHASLQRVERERLALERIGAVVEMDAGAVKGQGWDRRVLGDASQGSLRAIRLAHREDGVAHHLRAQRGLLPQGSVTELMQGDPIPTARGLHERYELIAGIRVRRLQRTQSGGLLRGHLQSNAGGAQHALAPLGDLLSTLDIALDGRGADRACGADVVRRRPQMPAPQPLLECRKALQQVPGAHPLEHLDRIGHRDGRGNADKQVDVIGLDLLGDHRPAAFVTDRLQQRAHFSGDRARQRVTPVFRTPDHMVGRLVEAIPVGHQINHVSHGYMYIHTGQASDAIPPLTEVRGFLAETL